MKKGKKKKILLLSSFAFGALNGGNISILALLRRLQKEGFICNISCLIKEKNRFLQVLRHQKIRYYLQKEKYITFRSQNIKINAVLLKKGEDPQEGLIYLLRKQKPDIVFTRSPDLDAVRVASHTNLSVCFFVDDIFSIDPYFGYLKEEDFLKLGKKTKLVAASFYLRKRIKGICPNEVLVLYPLIERNRFLAARKTPEYITLTNIDKVKGYIIFKELARLLPEFKFLGLDGWNRHPHLLTDLTLKNLKLKSQIIDMRLIYSRTKILLVPSLIGEGHCRVITEAMLNDIPVIGNNLGAIPETMDKAGKVIDVKPRGKKSFSFYISNVGYHQTTIAEYARQITQLMRDQSYYNVLSRKSRRGYLKITKIQEKLFANFLKTLRAEIK